jgi:hypothetical protein
VIIYCHLWCSNYSYYPLHTRILPKYHLFGGRIHPATFQTLSTSLLLSCVMYNKYVSSSAMSWNKLCIVSNLWQWTRMNFQEICHLSKKGTPPFTLWTCNESGRMNESYGIWDQTDPWIQVLFDNLTVLKEIKFLSI